MWETYLNKAVHCDSCKQHNLIYNIGTSPSARTDGVAEQLLSRTNPLKSSAARLWFPTTELRPGLPCVFLEMFHSACGSDLPVSYHFIHRGIYMGTVSLKWKGSQPQVVASLASPLSKLYLDVLEEVVDIPHEKQSKSSSGEEQKER